MASVLGLENAAQPEDPRQPENPISSSYKLKINQFEAERNQASDELKNRKAWFVISLVALSLTAYLCFWRQALPIWALVVPLSIAAIAGREASLCNKRIGELEHLLNSYRHRLRCVTHKWMGKGDPGVDLQMADHLSARDLDMFGEGSMFELLCDVGTPAGREALAKWLQAPASPPEALARQEGIRILRDCVDLREKLALLRQGQASALDWNNLRNWLVGETVEFPPWAARAALVLSISMAVAVACWWSGVIAGDIAIPAIVTLGAIEAVLALWLRPRVKSILDGLQMSGRKLGSLRRMCTLVENEKMEGRWLLELQKKLNGSAERIQRVEKRMGWLDLRLNELFYYPALMVMWTTQWTMWIERWRSHNELNGWIAALGEFEALVALAAYAYENPQDSFPEFVTEGPCFAGEGLRHPLMEVRTCVPNDLRLDGETQFLLVTGSNMSGKSTLLRTTGLNATLAWMGGPVPAKRLRLSELQICASIRVEDSLLNGRSRFYAEVQRLKATLDRAAAGPHVLFLVDEILGGTNSADRRVAAEGVIELLVKRQAIGLVTSHDLALAEIPEKDVTKGMNVHFSDMPTAEGLSFDYHLRPGKVDHSNALKIINMMGIPLNHAE